MNNESLNQFCVYLEEYLNREIKELEEYLENNNDMQIYYQEGQLQAFSETRQKMWEIKGIFSPHGTGEK